MVVEVRVPAVGESVREAMVHRWHKKEGDFVALDDVLVELETDKASVEVVAENQGVIHLLKKEGETVQIGEVIAILDSSAKKVDSLPDKREILSASSELKDRPSTPKGEAVKEEVLKLSPAVRTLVDVNSINPKDIIGTGREGRLLKADVMNHLSQQSLSSAISTKTGLSDVNFEETKNLVRCEERKSMSMLRRRIAERLLDAQKSAAILTTFNEIDMGAVINLRIKYKEIFKEKHGASLGFMSFFTRASVEALKAFPAMNSWIEGQDIVTPNYYDIGIAVSSERGLVVPVIRNSQSLSMAEIETRIAHYAQKARANKIELKDLTGGTFTISNGGSFGSLLSTPILNPPQSGILGLHKIEKRPIAVNEQIVIRPMMYTALSYDHRIVDGKEAVQFLVKLKESIEDPARLLLEI